MLASVCSFNGGELGADPTRAAPAAIWELNISPPSLTRPLATALENIERHPLARRLLAGLEPDFTARVLESESFHDLRTTLVPILVECQHAGWIRPDLPTADLADGLTAFILAMAMASVQIGPSIDRTFGRGITAILRGLLSEDPRLA